MRISPSGSLLRLALIASICGTAHAQTRISRGATNASNAIVVPAGATFGQSLAALFAQRMPVTAFHTIGDGSAPDTAAVQAACNATAGSVLVLPAGTYRIATTMTCGAGVLWFDPGAKLAIDAGVSFTASGRVISLGGDPTTGTGTLIYSDPANLFLNSNGLSLSKTPSVGTDDFFHIRRDIAGSTGIIIRNDDAVGTTTDSYIHMYGGPLTGVNQGSSMRLSAGNQANNGGLVNIVAENDAAFSLIQQADAPLDLYTSNVRQMQIASIPGAVNYWQFRGGLAGSAISMSPAGADANISITWTGKGTGSHFFRTGATPAFQAEIYDTPGAANRIRMTGGANPTLTTSAGNLLIGAPIILGASGTAISSSIRGTISWTPTAIATGACTSNTITVTGAVAGADAIVTPPSASSIMHLAVVVTANTCNITWCNASAGSITPPAGTYACRVFNP